MLFWIFFFCSKFFCVGTLNPDMPVLHDSTEDYTSESEVEASESGDRNCIFG